jgi:hypothetical protein
MLDYDRRELGWLAVAAGSAALTGSLVYKAMSRSWRAATDEDPPAARELGTTPWGKALLWAVGTAAVAAAAEVVAQKGAAAGWKRATGRRPPEL